MDTCFKLKEMVLDGKLREKLAQRPLKVVIVPHISPDGDAAGACSALWQVLHKVGVEAQVITCDYMPDYLKWLPRLDNTLSFQNRRKECRKWLNESDLLVMLDHNTRGREGDMEPYTRAFKGDVLMIDHHPAPEEATYRISDVTVSSTCELLYGVIMQLWGGEIIDTGIANALYTGISTDTGGLSHNSSHPETYRVVADLLALGLDKEYVHDRLYQTNSLSRLRLMGHCLLNKLEIDPQYPLAIIPITLEELEQFEYREGDLEGLVNVPLSIKEILVSVQVTQRKDRVKLSFRSKGDIPVNQWAKTHFAGGGHLNAAGGQMNLPPQEVVRLLKESAPWFFGLLENEPDLSGSQKSQ